MAFVLKMPKEAFTPNGVTLLEIIVAMVILSLVITGLANVFVAGKRHIQHIRYRMAAGEIGKKFIDPLQAYVREDTWASNPFGTNSLAPATSGVYTATYVISPHPADSNIKKVKTTVSWNEPQ